MFCGEHALGWLFQIERFFHYHNTPPDQSIDIASFYMMGLLQPLPIPEKIWDEVSMDFIIHLLPFMGKTTILVVVDKLSKYVHFCALGLNLSAPQLADVVAKEICCLHGFSSSIVSDRDPLFMSNFWRGLFKLQGTTLSTSNSYHPQSDNQTEVVNRCLEDYLRCFTTKQPKT